MSGYFSPLSCVLHRLLQDRTHRNVSITRSLWDGMKGRPVRFTFFVGGCVGYATCRCVELFLSCHKYCFVFVFLSLYLQLYPPLFKYTTHHFYISCFLRNGYFHFHSFVFSIAYHVLYLGHSYRRPSYTIVNKVAKISGLLVHRC